MSTTDADLRRRVITWSDPTATATAGRSMAGLDFLHALRGGALPPPPALLLGIEMVAAERGRAVMRLAPGEHLYNPLGTMHGGMIATLLDSVMGCAVQSTLPQGRFYTTLEIKVNYLRAVTEAVGMVSAEATVVQSGRQVAVAEARLSGADGRLYATASTTCLVFDLAETVPAPRAGGGSA